MKKIALMTFGLLLAASPAFAATAVNQINEFNGTADAVAGAYSDAGNAGASNVNVNNSSGVISQSANTGTSSNVGSSTDVVVTGGYSSRGGNVDVGNPNDYSSQMAAASLNQINAYNSTGNAALCAENSAYNAGISGVNVNASAGVIAQQVNTGVTSNVGSAIGVTVH